MSALIGRRAEIETLERAYGSREAELIAVYGRRRVGKTFLVRELFARRGIYLEVTGEKDAPLGKQLERFAQRFSEVFHPGLPLRTPADWGEAFSYLTTEISRLPRGKKAVVFLDEIPWLAGKRSGLLPALDHFWNTRWSRLPAMKIVVCGSAASWVLEHLINAKGGLYNRLTRSLLLEPFNLGETRAFLAARSVRLKEPQILELYLAMGGVPHYLQQVEPGRTAAENIQRICFAKNGLLRLEFPRLFASLFEAGDESLRIAQEVARHRYGVSREALLERLGAASGGTFSRRIEELEASGFIHGFVPLGRKAKDRYYRIWDEYTGFYLKWIEPVAGDPRRPVPASYWLHKSRTPAYLSWAGLAFETLCFKQEERIRSRLGLEGMACEVGSWRGRPARGSREPGAQIDLLFDREDGAVTLCEIKYTREPFTIDKAYARRLEEKIRIFERRHPRAKQIFLALVSAAGLRPNLWSRDLVDATVELRDLF